MELKELTESGPEGTAKNEVIAQVLHRPFRKVDGRSDTEPLHQQFGRALDDATRLLLFAAESGVHVEESVREGVLRAANADLGVDEKASAALIGALTKLAAQLRPVTADTLRATDGQARPAISSLRRWTLRLAIPIVLFSLVGFVTSSLSSTIRDDITTANDLAVKLRSELGTTKDPIAPKGLNEAQAITDLQLYATTIRSIDNRTRQLNWFVLNSQWDQFKDERSSNRQDPTEARDNRDTFRNDFELPSTLVDLPKTFEDLTKTYQDERSFGKNVVDLVSVSYGAITFCLLPVLYALLGTCAYLLRRFEKEMKARTFTPCTRANWAHFLVAGIGGAVVGLFNFSLTQQGASISPLAIAFLVGYAVDVFFSFLEGILQSLTRN